MSVLRGHLCPGAILYELLTGRPPFRAETAIDTLMQVCHRTSGHHVNCSRRYPATWRTICLKCLEKEIPKRYSSAQAVADDLRRFLEGQAILARP